jgi:hypothetical protein
MKIVKLKNGKYALRKWSFLYFGYHYADKSDLLSNNELFWWSGEIGNYFEFDSLDELESAIANYTYQPPVEVIKKVKFGKS